VLTKVGSYAPNFGIHRSSVMIITIVVVAIDYTTVPLRLDQSLFHSCAACPQYFRVISL